MDIQERINFLEENIEGQKVLISETKSLILDAEDEIEELQENIENWKVYIGDKENNINELESELEALRSEQTEQYLKKTNADDRDWHSMKL